MASRRLALIGCCEGPWVDISRVLEPVIRVSGLQNATVKAEFAPAGFPLFISADGDHPIKLHPEGFKITGMKLFVDKKCPKLVCEVISGKVA